MRFFLKLKKNYTNYMMLFVALFFTNLIINQ